MASGTSLAVLVLSCLASSSAVSVATVSGGVYGRVTARIEANAVPERHHCRRAVKNLQVSSVTCLSLGPRY